jgi:hypothetical protein
MTCSREERVLKSLKRKELARWMPIAKKKRRLEAAVGNQMGEFESSKK